MNEESCQHGLSEQDLKFNYRSGSLCLYLVETFGEWIGRRYDRILNATVWNEWLKSVGLPALTHPASQKDLQAMSELRRAIYGIAQSRVKGLEALPADIQVINQYALHPTFPAQLAHDGKTSIYTTKVTQSEILSYIARDAIDLFSGEYANRIRECKSHICPVVFVDKSRRGDRMWCSTNCGAREATAKYRHKQSLIKD